MEVFEVWFVVIVQPFASGGTDFFSRSFDQRGTDFFSRSFDQRGTDAVAMVLGIATGVE